MSYYAKVEYGTLYPKTSEDVAPILDILHRISEGIEGDLGDDGTIEVYRAKISYRESDFIALERHLKDGSLICFSSEEDTGVWTLRMEDGSFIDHKGEFDEETEDRIYIVVNSDSVWVNSDENPNGIEVDFSGSECLPAEKKALIAVAEFLGFDPSSNLCFDDDVAECIRR